MQGISVEAAGNTIGTSTGISLNQNYNGNLSKSNRVDFYKFSLPSAGEINVNISSEADGVVYYIIDANNEELYEKKYNSLDENTMKSNVKFKLNLTSGNYYFKVERSGNTESKFYGKYNFKIDFIIAGD